MSILLCGITPDSAMDSRNPGSKVRDAYRLPKSERLTEIRREPTSAEYVSDVELRDLVGRDYLK